MTARDVYLPVAAQPSVDTLVGMSQQAEDRGYDRVGSQKRGGGTR